MPAELEIYYAIGAALAGLLIGSFLNVCIYRVPRDISVAAPRSFCPECGKQISWFDNVPLISYLLLRGKCRYCNKAIGWRYPAVELITALLFTLVVLRYGWSLASVKWIIFEAILVVLFWTDLEERILPDEFTLGGTLLGLIFAFFIPVPGFAELFFPQWKTYWQSLLNAGIAVLFLLTPIWLVAALYTRFRKREGLGLGDLKLILLIGVFLGLEKGISVLLLGAIAGSLIGVGYILTTRKSATYELPFGSFLCVAAAISPLISKI